MSTTAEIQIAPLPTAEEVALTLLQWLFATIGIPTDYNIGSIIRTYSEAIGSVEEVEGVTAQAQAIQAMVYSAYSVFGISPEGAQTATGTVTFSTLSSAPLPAGQSVLIPINTVVQTPSGVQFSTTSSVVLVSGLSSVNAPVQAVVPGSSGNVNTGLINQISTGLAYPLQVTNVSGTLGGADAETPSKTLNRFLAYVYSLGLCSPIAIAAAAIGVAYQQEQVVYATCYDKQTEILTEDGWILFPELINQPFVKVATLNPETHELEYQEVEQYHKYWYEGKLVTINNRFLDLAVTPDHNMYVKPAPCNGKESTWRFVKAEDLSHTQSVKRDCIWKGEEVEYYEFGEYKIPMDLWLEFLGYYISEGCTGKYPNYVYSTQIRQSKGDSHQIIRECLEKLPFKFYESEDSFRSLNKSLYEELIPLGKSNEKYIPRYVKKLSSRQLLILLEALSLGDGMLRDAEGKKEWKYFTCSKKLVDDVQEVVLKCGMASSIKIDDKRGKPAIIKGRGITGYTNYLSYILCIHRYHLENQLKDSISTIDYHGNVYCVTVPNHIIYVRRNGKVTWSGNCFENWIAQVMGGSTTPTAGFQVYIDNGAVTPTSLPSVNLINAVTIYLNTGVGVNAAGQAIGNKVGYRPAGVPFQVLSVQPLFCSVVVVAKAINSSLAAQITSNMTEAINNYFTSLNFGMPAEITALTAAVADVSFGQLTSLAITLLNNQSVSVPTIPGPLDPPIQGFNRVQLTGVGVTVQ